MITTLRTDITIEEICNGFTYNELEGKGLYGMSGKLVIQPEYQRNYIYAKEKKEQAVIESVLKGYPLGLIYFVKIGDDKYEILDGQQRITSLGRFKTAKFSIVDANGTPRYYEGMPQDQKEKFLNTKLTIYICEGTETEIKEWFETINITGIPLNKQELRNAIHSGPFVTAAKQEYSNSLNANVQKWSHYINATVERQEYLETALNWVSKGHIDEYMSAHRYDNHITELKAYFESVIGWVSTVFLDTDSSMKGLNWGLLYENFHKNAYNPQIISAKVQELLADEYVKNKKGIYPFILDGETDTRLLEVRIFDEHTKKVTYVKQTKVAKAKGISNCPMCAKEKGKNYNKIYAQKEMDADHITAWSKGGSTDPKNCQMLCRTHNHIKGNK